MKIKRRRLSKSVERMTDASMKALDTPEGGQILQDMIDKKISIEDGIAKLLVMSGEYDYRPGQEPKEDK